MTEHSPSRAQIERAAHSDRSRRGHDLSIGDEIADIRHAELETLGSNGHRARFGHVVAFSVKLGLEFRPLNGIF
ncbi:hypothetical protein [Rhizobium leguminosarum]|uniref:hypothetical protein n=1 Tax=Rhizobium leguminosarum TaxID=384 RepID=UPI0028F44764|nr:hypothetical protein [Rhizobium leguminosarum]